ncbi:Hypothetical protein HVR_LOCUS845 [uncultured virus]|nr:Hypothetical protein HVR_LOCUS845 [uncultured virus]
MEDIYIKLNNGLLNDPESHSFIVHLMFGSGPRSKALFKLRDKYNAELIEIMWIYFRTNDKRCLNIYPDILCLEQRIDEIGQNNINDIVKKNSKYYGLCIKYFNLIIDDKNNSSVIRVIPNLMNEDIFFIIRIKDKFLTCICGTRVSLLDKLNEQYIKNNLFGSVLLIDYYSE